MKDLDLSSLFCEILSGLAVGVLGLGILQLAGVLTMVEAVAWVAEHQSFVNLALLLGSSFLLGLLVDAVGLWFDEIVIESSDRLKKFLRYSEVPAPTGFYKTVSQHALQHYKEQWTYYSCYRNLLMLLLPGLPVAAVITGSAAGAIWAGVVVLLLSLGGCALVVSIRVLQPLMGRILDDHKP